MLTTEQIRTTVADYFKDKPVKKVYLFGSYARGDEDKNSDIDILVHLDYSKKIGIDFIKWHIALEDYLKKKIDLVPDDVMYESVKAGANRDKILILSNDR
ncbi:MAG: nucleotidyltransferase family protein [Chitinophagaceae bacterium]